MAFSLVRFDHEQVFPTNSLVLENVQLGFLFSKDSDYVGIFITASPLGL